MTTTAPTLAVEIDFTTNLSSGLAYYEKVLADGPYAYHRLKETSGTALADSSGNGRGATVVGSITLNLTSGKPVSGETASRYIDMNTGARLAWARPPSGVTRYTWEAWVYRSSLDGNAATKYHIFSVLGNSVRGAHFAILGNGKLYYRAAVSEATTTTTPIAATTWYHVALVVDAVEDTATFYVNGTQLTTSWSLAGSAPNQAGWLQTAPYNAEYVWGAAEAAHLTVSRLAEPAFYTESLSEAQLSDHYGAAATVPFAGYTWTDVTSYVLRDPGISRSFGRESSAEEVQPMTLEYVLVNDDRRFEVGNTASPYNPNVVPGRPTRIQLTQDAVTYDWAFGFIEDFPQSWDVSGKFGRVRIVAHDYLERMNQYELGSRTLAEQPSGSRIGSLANIAGVPTANRAIDAGDEDVMAQTVESGTVGDHARQVARTDRGMVFFDGRGYLVFQDGTYRTVNSRSTASRGTLGRVGSADIVTLGAPEFHAPTSLIRNEIAIRRPGGVEQTAADGVSRSKYGPRSHSDELLFPTDAEAATRAAELLADYKDPQLRVRAISFNPARTPGQWDHSLGVQLSDRYTWRFEPLQGSAIVRDVFVEGVSDRWVGSEYRSTWFLSLA